MKTSQFNQNNSLKSLNEQKIESFSSIATSSLNRVIKFDRDIMPNNA